MIQANELRIGNFYNQFGNLHQATGHTIIDLAKAPESQLWCKPIPLTPEILEKCGFVMLHHLGKLQPTKRIDDHLEFHWNYGQLYVTFSEDNYCENAESSISIVERYLENIKYLHQLQNLYYALTGEELTYNP